jgi:DNA-binding MarR family transcriptional regulator
MTTICAKGNPEDFSQSFMYSVHQMHFLVSKHLDHILLTKKALTFSQFMILVAFKCPNSGSVSQQDIALQLDLTEATVSRHIASLVSLGYILRSEDASNRRRHILSLTTKGNNAFQKAKAIIDQELSTLFSVVKESERNTIMKLFSTVLTQLSTMK